MKKTITVFLSLVILLQSVSLFGCTKKSDETIIPDSPDTKVAENTVQNDSTQKKLDFTSDEARDANTLQTLLSEYPSVHIITSFDEDEENGDTWAFLFDNTPAYVNVIKNPSGEDFIRGSYKGVFFEGTIDDMSVIPSSFSYDIAEQLVSSVFDSEADMHYVSETDDTVSVRYIYDYGIKEISLDKKTLAVKRCEWTSDYSHSVTEYDYTADPADLHYLDAWAGEIHTATLVVYTEPDAEPNIQKFPVPLGWKLSFAEEYSEYSLYADENLTSEFVYPEEPTDFTVYLSSSKG